MPGPSSSTCSSTRSPTARTPTVTRVVGELQRVLDEVGDDLREPFGIDVAGDRVAGLDGRAPRRARWRRARTPRPRRARPRARRPARGAARTGARRAGRGRGGRRPAARVGATPTRSRRRRGCASSMPSTVPSAIASAYPRIDVSGVRRSCDTLSRNARSCRATSRSLAIALMACASSASSSSRTCGGVDPRREVTAGDRTGGGLHRGERAGHAPGEVGRDERGDAERDGRGAEHREAVAAERSVVDLFGEHHDGGGAVRPR